MFVPAVMKQQWTLNVMDLHPKPASDTWHALEKFTHVALHPTMPPMHAY